MKKEPEESLKEGLKKIVKDEILEEKSKTSDIKSLFTFLKYVDENHKDFISLKKFIREFQEITMDLPKYKYELMYKIIKIYDCIEAVCGEIDSSIKILDDFKQAKSVKVCNLAEIQQNAIFKLAKNIVEDHFQLLYEEQVENCLKNFKSLCFGETDPYSFLAIKRKCDLYQRGTDLKFFFKNYNNGKERIKKFVNQTAYFITKFDEFVKKDDYDAARMALIGAGTCSRLYNQSGMNPVKKGSIFKVIANARDDLCHGDLKHSNKFLKEFNVSDTITFLQKEAGFEIKTDVYAKSETNEELQQESPRAIDKKTLGF